MRDFNYAPCCYNQTKKEMFQYCYMMETIKLSEYKEVLLHRVN